MSTEQHIKMAAKLYKCRDTAKSLFGDEYLARIFKYKMNIEQVMKDEKLEAIPALIEISKLNHYQVSGMAQMMYMAAVVEIIEPSEK